MACQQMPLATLHTWMDVADAVLLAGVHKLTSDSSRKNATTVYRTSTAGRKVTISLESLHVVYGYEEDNAALVVRPAHAGDKRTVATRKGLGQALPVEDILRMVRET